jgi:hypothetical protein
LCSVTLAYSAVTARRRTRRYACALISITDTNNESTPSTGSQNNNMNNPNERFSPIICYMRCLSNTIQIFHIENSYYLYAILLAHGLSHTE